LSKVNSKKILGVFITLLFFISGTKAQDAVFSQFYNSTLYLNPSLAGIEEDFIFTSNFREQWGSLIPYYTSQVSVIMPIYDSKHSKPLGHKGGVGLSLYNDMAGLNENFKTIGATGNFAYNLPLDPKHVNVIYFGVQGGFIQKRIDTSTLEWGSQYNPYLGASDATIIPTDNLDFRNKAYLDIGSGVFWWHNPVPSENQKVLSINSGLSVAHMNNPNESMIIDDLHRLPLLYKYHGGIVFKMGVHLTGSVNVLVAYQNSTSQQNFGSYLTYRFFASGSELFAENFVRLGAWYRVKDAAIMLTEFETKKFKVGFSYDWNTSTLRYNNLGINTYEVYFGIKFSQYGPPKSRY